MCIRDRAWTFRQVHWLAQQHGIALETPAQHPFNPLPLLRLALASRVDLQPNRRVVQALFRHVWVGGADALAPDRLAALTEEVAPVLDPGSPAVKQALRASTEAAVQAGVFGVPSFECEGRLFWGLDALPMLRDAMMGGAWFDGPAWEGEGRPRPGVRRA